MTSAEMPTERFRLSMLIYDTRYRSLTIQVFALLAFMLAAAWLVNNTVQNLAALGKTFDFGFLWTRAGYDISQQLIPYTNDDTHARAALVGGAVLARLAARGVGEQRRTTSRYRGPAQEQSPIDTRQKLIRQGSSSPSGRAAC